MHCTIPRVPLVLFGPALLLSACGAPSASDAGTQPIPGATPHGYLAGVQENAEPQTGLLTLDRETGEAQLLSLLTGETVDAGAFGPIEAVHQDGRYAFITGRDGVEVFDTGAWTVTHGDHDHYYSTDPGPVGSLDVPGAGAIAGDGEVVAVFSDSGGYASLYSTKDLDAGEVIETGRVTTSPHDGVVVPFEDHFLASVAGADGAGGAPHGVEIRDGENRTVRAEASCPGLSAHARTRAGVVFACTDGALLVTEDDGAFSAEHIPYPSNGAAEPVTSFEHRPGSSELAGPAGSTGVWHLDVSEREWTLLRTPVPVVAAAAVGDTQRVLAVGADGSLLSLDPASGEVLHSAQLLEDGAGPMPQLRIDTARAYLGDPEAGIVHEIDYADGLRVARTFEVPAVDFLLETGL